MLEIYDLYLLDFSTAVVRQAGLTIDNKSRHGNHRFYIKNKLHILTADCKISDFFMYDN